MNTQNARRAALRKVRRLDRNVHWSIAVGGNRSAHVGEYLLLVAARVGRGPVRWGVATAAGLVSSGIVYQGVEYSALERQAMLEAESAVACDDCGGVSGHDLRVEH